MSVIALTLNNCYEDGAISPILIGDLLVTSKDKTINLSLPTFNEGVDSLLPDNEYLPSDIIQKIYVIANQFIIGLAGSVSEMKLVLIAFKEFIKYEKIRNESLGTNFTKEILLKFDSIAKEMELSNCSFCTGYTGKDSNFYFVRFGKWFEGVTHNFGNLCATGSGADDFFEIANQNSYPNKFDESASMQAIMMHHMNLFGQMISLEKATLQTIKNFWGINYEMIIPSEHGFNKANNITHLISQVYIDLTTNNPTIERMFLYNSIYHDDMLLIRAYDVENKIFNGYTVCPLDRMGKIDTKEFPAVRNFQAGNLSTTYFFSFSNGETRQNTYYLQNYTNEHGKALSHRIGSFANGGVEIAINPNIENAIFAKAIQSVMENDQTFLKKISTILGSDEF